MRRRESLVILIASLFLCGCPTVYRDFSEIPPDKQPLLPREFLDLRRGMTADKVRAVMGQPDETTSVADIWYPVEDQKTNQIKVLYVEGKAVRATWISMSDDVHFVLFQ